MLFNILKKNSLLSVYFITKRSLSTELDIITKENTFNELSSQTPNLEN